MKIMKRDPNPFFYQGNREIAILLIHGFTGSPAEVRLLGEFLYNQGYTVNAPLLAGHGTTPEEMALTNKEDWWKSVIEGYDFLNNKGYKKIIAVGLSMGGILSLKLAASQKELMAVIPMAAPVIVHDKRIVLSRWIKYIKPYKVKNKKIDYIEQYLASYDRTPIVCVESLYSLIKEVKGIIPSISIPILVLQGKKDETVHYKSAQYIYDFVDSKVKDVKWYENSSHILTLDKDKEKVYVDILAFLEMIDKKDI